MIGWLVLEIVFNYRTSKQTNRQMKWQSEILYLPKFPSMIMLTMHTKLEDDIFVRSLFMTKNVMFIKEYRETIWGLPVTSSMTSSPWKYFSLHNLGWSFYFWCEIEAVFDILTFSNWPPFWDRNANFTMSDTGNRICKNDSQENLWDFELLIDALAEILTELLQFKVLTHFETQWRHQ